MNVLDLVLRIILISIPEQTFIVMFSIGLLGADSMLLLRKNRLKLSIIIFVQAILSVLPMIVSLNSSIGPIFELFELTFLLFVIERKNIFKIMLYIFGTMLVFMITEFACINLILYSTDIKTIDFEMNVFLSFGASLVERAPQFLILYFVLSRKIKLTTGREKSIFEVLMGSPKKRKITMLFIGINIAYLIIIGKAFMFQKILSDLPSLSAIILCTFSMLMPFISLGVLIYYTKQNCINNDAYVNLLVWEMKCRAEAIIEEAEKSNNVEVKNTVNNLLFTIENT